MAGPPKAVAPNLRKARNKWDNEGLWLPSCRSSCLKTFPLVSDDALDTASREMRILIQGFLSLTRIRAVIRHSLLNPITPISSHLHEAEGLDFSIQILVLHFQIIGKYQKPE
jgi:hypothetical protein